MPESIAREGRDNERSFRDSDKQLTFEWVQQWRHFAHWSKPRLWMTANGKWFGDLPQNCEAIKTRKLFHTVSSNRNVVSNVFAKQ